MSTSASLPVPVEYAEVAAICTATEVLIGGQTVLGIADARDLHKGLKVRRDYATWITARIAKYGFREGEDYQILLPKSGEQTGSGGHNARIYVLTLNMAKELAMVENNEQGRLIRRYFIWADNQLHARLSAGQSAQLPAPLDYVDQLTAIRDENRKLYGALKKQQVEQANRVLDRLERMATGLTALGRNVRYSCKADRDILNIVRDALVTEARQAITAVKVDVNVPPAPAPVPAPALPVPMTVGRAVPRGEEGDYLVNLKEVCAIFSIGTSTVYRWIADRGFPKPIRYSPVCTRWWMSEVNEWMAAQQ